MDLRLIFALLALILALGLRLVHAVCKDSLDLCPSYVQLCSNSFVKNKCPKTCKLCVAECEDTIPYCAQYLLGPKMCDTTNQDLNFLTKNCGLTCSLCPPETMPTIPPPPVYPPGEIKGDCGKRPAKRPSIVGGSSTQPGTWPWQITITYPSRQKNHYCGGILVADRWVVTAAHCVLMTHDAYVTLGEHDLNVNEGTEQRIKVSKIISHPGFSWQTYGNDVALMKLSTPAQMNDQVQPACLIKHDMEFEIGTMCWISGWGTTIHGREGNSGVLMEAKVPIVHKSECQDAYKDINEVDDTMLCAGYRGGTIDTCQGDSGGPLVCETTQSDGSEKWYLTGITSWGVGCGTKGYYGVYSDVKALRNFITKTIEDNTL